VVEDLFDSLPPHKRAIVVYAPKSGEIWDASRRYLSNYGKNGLDLRMVGE
jgi:hypothetical protein